MRLFGVVGADEAATTRLMGLLVAEIGARGLRVSTVKQARAGFDVDQPGKDSHRHRTAGATEVLLSSRKRFALMHELRGAPEPALEVLLAKLAPVDLVLVEGYGSAKHAKIEAYRSETGGDPLASKDATIRAVATGDALRLDRPVFGLDDGTAIADFILAEVGL
jgi:molybdopterin-guanine dinucleotide biosynthesis protein MobB